MWDSSLLRRFRIGGAVGKGTVMMAAAMGLTLALPATGHAFLDLCVGESRGCGDVCPVYGYDYGYGYGSYAASGCGATYPAYSGYAGYWGYQGAMAYPYIPVQTVVYPMVPVVYAPVIVW